MQSAHGAAVVSRALGTHPRCGHAEAYPHIGLGLSRPECSPYLQWPMLPQELQIRLTVIICGYGYCLCRFAYLLKCICDLKINTLTIQSGHAQRGGMCPYVSSWGERRPRSASLFQLSSRWPEDGASAGQRALCGAAGLSVSPHSPLGAGQLWASHLTRLSLGFFFIKWKKEEPITWILFRV